LKWSLHFTIVALFSSISHFHVLHHRVIERIDVYCCAFWQALCLHSLHEMMGMYILLPFYFFNVIAFKISVLFWLTLFKWFWKKLSSYFLLLYLLWMRSSSCISMTAEGLMFFEILLTFHKLYQCSLLLLHIETAWNWENSSNTTAFKEHVWS